MRKALVTGFLLLSACTREAKPEWETRYEKARSEADAAFTANQLARAGELFRTASEALPAGDSRKEECAQRIATCRFLELREMGLKLFADGKVSEAILVLEDAVKALPKGDPRIAEAQEKLNGLRFQARSRAGREKMARQNWLEAAKDFEAALEFAAADQKQETNALIGFCRKFAEADEAFLGKKDYAKAAPLYEELLKNPHGLSKETGPRAVGQERTDEDREPREAPRGLQQGHDADRAIPEKRLAGAVEEHRGPARRAAEEVTRRLSVYFVTLPT